MAVSKIILNGVTQVDLTGNARSLFTNGRTYTYKFVKWTT